MSKKLPDNILAQYTWFDGDAGNGLPTHGKGVHKGEEEYRFEIHFSMPHLQQHSGRVMYLDRFSYNPIELAIFGVVKNKLHKYLVLWYCTYLRTYLPKKNGDG